MGYQRAAHHAGGDDVRAWHHRHSGGGYANRRRWFSGKTDRLAKTADDGRSGVAHPAANVTARAEYGLSRQSAADRGAARASRVDQEFEDAAAAHRRAGLRKDAVRPLPACAKYTVG